jgi:gamma-glutamylcyclotransferase
MRSRFYFAYGSNLHPSWLRSRVPSAKILTRLDVAHWKLLFHKAGTDDSAKCNIIPSNSAEDIIHGVIYEFNAMEQDKLDEVEFGYHARSMQFGHYKDVLIYIARDENINDQLLPYSWYRDIVIAGAEYDRDKQYRSIISTGSG